MSSLENLQKQLEQELNISSVEACERLTRAMAFAINIPLGTIKMGAELLKGHAEAVSVQQWADQCYQQSLIWRDVFRQTLSDCLGQPDTSCYCFLQQSEKLFDRSPALLTAGQSLSVETKLAEAQTLLLRNLVALSQIHLQLQGQDFSWLLPHLPMKQSRD